MRFTIATYNIHKGFSHLTRKVVIHELKDRLHGLSADILFLQEVQGVHRRHARRYHNWPGKPQHEFIADTVWHEVAYGRNAVYQHGHHGNAVLSRYAFTSIARLDLAVRNYEPRGALDVCVHVGAQQLLRVVATHLGLRPGERREQVQRLIAVIESDVPHPTVLMGDVNEWFLWGRPLRWLHTHFREEPAAPRTFPSWRPMFALDRIWVSPVGRLQRLARHASPLARIASDHLPLKAEIVVSR